MFRFFERLVQAHPDAEARQPPGTLDRVRLALHRGHAAAHRADDAGHRADRRVRGGAVRLPRPGGGLARQGHAATLWRQHGGTLALLAAVLAARIALVALQTMLKHQSLAGNFPMRLRWNFHRRMLGQSMAFYQDEFAGRVAAR